MKKHVSELRGVNPETIEFIGFVESGSMGRAGDITFIDENGVIYEGIHLMRGQLKDF